MRMKILLLVITLLVASFAIADLTSDLEEIRDQSLGEQMPEPLSTLFGDERVNIKVRGSDDTVVGVVTQDGIVTSFEFEELDDPTLDVMVNRGTISRIVNSNKPLVILKKALSEDEITYEARGFFRKIRFAILPMFISLAPSDDELEGSEEVEDGAESEPVDETNEVEEETSSDDGDDDIQAPNENEMEEESDETADEESEEDAVDEPSENEDGDMEESTSSTTHTVTISTDDEFVPDTLTVKVGDTVTWENRREGVASRTKAMLVGNGMCRDLKSDIFTAGESYSYTFTQAQRCNLADAVWNLGMKVVVE